MINNIKSLWMAQYLGQKVYTCKDWECFNDKSLKPVDSTFLQTGSNRLFQGYLILRLINQLTDEEARLIGFESAKAVNDLIIRCKTFSKFVNTCLANWQCQILLQLGILLPFSYLDNGTIIHLSPIQILERGWAKEKRSGKELTIKL